MKEYILKIGFDPVTEEVIYVQEYIEGAKAILHIDNKEIELDEEVANYVVKDEIGVT